MFKNMKRFLLIFIITASYAGDEVGNGGDVIDCSGKIELLDYDEAKKSGLLIAHEGKSYVTILDEFLKKFKKIDPLLAQQYLRRAATIVSEISFEGNIVLKDVKDSLHASVPTGCQLRQIAIRLSKEKVLANGDRKKFVVDKSLWDKMLEIDRAGLILHEIIYEHFIYLGEKDSRKARYLNGLIGHIGSGHKTSKPFSKILKEMHIPIYR